MCINREELQKIEQKFGDSFFLLDMDLFERNYQEFLSAFQRFYPKTNIAYSYKTNYLPRICQVVHRMGGYAEVVSRMEFQLAQEINVPGNRIIFNGPYKTKDDLKEALIAGAIVNIDSFYEIDLIEELVKEVPNKPFSLGIRCNIDLGEEASRFGFDIDKDLDDVFHRLQAIKNVTIIGLHCHICTATKDPVAYALMTDKMIELVKHYYPNHPPQFIDLGGGFFSRMHAELKQQFNFHVANIEEYAEVIAGRLRNAFPGLNGPELILEPGLALTADIMLFCAKVIGIKHIRNRCLALVSGSVYDIKPTLHRKNLPLHVVSQHSLNLEHHSSIDIVGYSCMEHDTLYRGYQGPLAPGDYVIFENTGAYTLVLAPQFIRPRPPVLGLSREMNSIEILRRREQNSDIFAVYEFQ